VPSSLDYSGRIIDGGTSVAVPLIVREQCVGVLVARLSANEPWDSDRRSRVELLEVFSSWAAIALHNAEVHGRTEDLMKMLASLRRVIDAISSSLDLKHVLRALVRTTAHVMNAKACAILLAGESDRLEVAQSYNLSREFRGKLKIRPGEKWTGIAFAEKKPITRTDIAAEDLPISEHALKEGLHGLICAPLIVGDQAMGTINVWTDAPHTAKAMEIHLLSSIASHAAAVIANAKLFGREYQIAETLQNTLKGEVPERIGRLSFGHKYLPALDEASVGGDLYDVINLPDGRVGVIVADVAGKGIQAAVHTSMVRYMGRAYLLENPDSPAQVLWRLNEAIVHFAGSGLVVTVFIAVIDAATGHAVYANAGHPPALLLTQQGRQQILLYRTGVPVGFTEQSAYDDRSADLKPGDTLLIYTDGIIEARKNGKLLNVEGLEDILFRHCDLGPVEMVETICQETDSYSNHRLTDDIAIVAAGFDIDSRREGV
jgi:serine phosphatase RsbU (regulator of sigma subunit)